MNFVNAASEVLKNVGGKENVILCTHCATRLRFEVKEQSKVNINAIKKIGGVYNVAKVDNQYQIIIGTDVDKLYTEVSKLIGNTSENKTKEKFSFRSVLNSVVQYIGASVGTFIPMLVGASLLKTILMACSSLGLMSIDGSTYAILTFVSDIAFSFMPVLLALGACKYFNLNPGFGVYIALAMVSPSWETIVANGGAVSILGLPAHLVSYSSSFLPILLTIWVLNYVDKLLDKYIPDIIKTMAKPPLILLIMTPVAFCITGPIMSYISGFLASIVIPIGNHVGWLYTIMIGACYPILVMLGLHMAIGIPMVTLMFTIGYDALWFPGVLASAFAMAGSALAYALKTKSKTNRQVAITASVTNLTAGITEPTIFGVLVKEKKAMIGCAFGGAVGAAVATIIGVRCFTLGMINIFSFPYFVGEGSSIVGAIITAAVSFVVAFVCVYVFYKDTVDESGNVNIKSPLKGKTISLSDVDDIAFSRKQLGEGIAIKPEDEKIYAPFDGTVSVLAETKHAIGIIADSGVEVLIHVGLDTVTCNGEPFTSYVSIGDVIKEGQLLMDVDFKAIESKGMDTVTCIVVTNSSEYQQVTHTNAKEVKKGDDIVTVII